MTKTACSPLKIDPRHECCAHGVHFLIALSPWSPVIFYGGKGIPPEKSFKAPIRTTPPYLQFPVDRYTSRTICLQDTACYYNGSYRNESLSVFDHVDLQFHVVTLVRLWCTGDMSRVGVMRPFIRPNLAAQEVDLPTHKALASCTVTLLD